MRIGFASIRARFIALLLIGAGPLLITAAVFTFQASQSIEDRARQRLIVVGAMAKVREASFLSEGEHFLANVAARARPGWTDPGACSAGLGDVLTISGDLYASLVLVDASSRLICRVGAAGDRMILTPPEADAVAAARATGRFAVGRFGWSATTSRAPVVLPIAYPLRPDAPGAPSGVLLATINEDRLLLGAEEIVLNGPVFAWVMSPSGPLATLGERKDDAVPSATDLARIARSPDHETEGRGADGQRYVYVTARFSKDTDLLLAQPVVNVLGSADPGLQRRLAALTLVLLGGLGLVAAGADLTVGRPLQRVAKAVARWRAGGRFEVENLSWAPVEITALAHSFAEATVALSVREQQLRAAAVQQELLMQEIHHRVKNNLQVVASLLNLQANRIRDPAARAEFHAARDRIRALATLHRHLYAHGELHTINMRGFLEELCEQLLRAMGETPAGGRITLTIEASELRISSDQAVPMALLVTEVVSNAVKYAFPGGRPGHIAVRLTVSADEDGQETATLTIDDDGIGIPAGQAETESGVRDGIGLKLIRGFARQLGATLQVSEEHGTHYVVRMALQRERAMTDLDADDDAMPPEE